MHFWTDTLTGIHTATYQHTYTHTTRNCSQSQGLTHSLFPDLRPLICKGANLLSLRFADHCPWGAKDQNFPRPKMASKGVGSCLSFLISLAVLSAKCLFFLRSPRWFYWPPLQKEQSPRVHHETRTSPAHRTSCTETFCSQGTIESARDQEMLHATALPLLINHPNPL